MFKAKILFAFMATPLLAATNSYTHQLTLKDSSPTVRVRIYDDCGMRYLCLEAYGNNWFNKERFMDEFFNGNHLTYYPYHTFEKVTWTEREVQQYHPFTFNNSLLCV